MRNHSHRNLPSRRAMRVCSVLIPATAALPSVCVDSVDHRADWKITSEEQQAP
jgi:hypothetical protein